LWGRRGDYTISSPFERGVLKISSPYCAREEGEMGGIIFRSSGEDYSITFPFRGERRDDITSLSFHERRRGEIISFVQERRGGGVSAIIEFPFDVGEG
jgi:hypothetical protein